MACYKKFKSIRKIRNPVSLFLESGETSTGYPVINVGCKSFGSTRISNSLCDNLSFDVRSLLS